jgi:hypothetical protein
VHVDANSSIGLCDASGDCRQAVRSNKVPFENAIVDQTLHAEVRDREFAWLDIDDDKPIPQNARRMPTSSKRCAGRAPRHRLLQYLRRRVDAAGQLYFVDAHFQRIYRWSPESKYAAW